MKARERAQPQRPKWQNPLDDSATFERIYNLLGALSLDPIRLGQYELNAPEEERELICLYAALQRPKDAQSGVRHFTACRLSLSWQFPEDYGPAAQSDVRRQKLIGLLMGEDPSR
jgi:hypothetical protein